MSDQPEAHRKQRVQDTRQKYGPVGLQKLADKLAHAQQANNRPHPDSFIANFPVPTLQSIQWIDVQIAKGTEPYWPNVCKLLVPIQIPGTHINSTIKVIPTSINSYILPKTAFTAQMCLIHLRECLPIPSPILSHHHQPPLALQTNSHP
ncbi:hypothetical protein PCANC_23972 [Puccinia coronata f. sp. avenae]|uniref:Uncharacterized protein n=1 Tax=Puccinia coronata f. sp. avenae TaxID=200324 RepID=A0A2N5TV38_9BASI|nr:hypothetical protein PCANC_23972 [Puccinia coronata f. sp. avenae]